jgi:hypothetical protein
MSTQNPSTAADIGGNPTTLPEGSQEDLPNNDGSENGSLQAESTPHSRAFLFTAAQIVLTAAVILVPLILLSETLVGIVFQYCVRHTQSTSSVLVSDLEDEPRVYYVNINSTRLVLIASLSSSVATLLTGFFMALVSYPVSRRIFEHSMAQRSKELPTAHQLGLLIITLNGGLGAFWHWVRYIYRKRGQNKTAKLVKISFWGLTTANILMYISW